MNEKMNYILWVSAIVIILSMPSVGFIIYHYYYTGIGLFIFPIVYILNRLTIRFMNEIESGCLLLVLLILASMLIPAISLIISKNNKIAIIQSDIK